MFRLDNKTALVTGAASGIGAAIAQAYAGCGARVYIGDIKEPAQPDNFIRVDVASEEDCQRAARHIGRVDILVNNAGIGFVGTLMQTAAADFDRMYSVNLRGVFNMSRAFLPAMLERRYGVIVNIASIGGIVGVKDRLAYCAMKFGVVGITKCMALDHATDGIRVNCICPGRVETPFVQQRIREYPDPERAYREMAATQPIGRMGWPAEIAAAAVYLASDEAAFVTGSALIIDGGFSAGK
ncbi:MAG TPA: SDR family oxidoreductase [Bryobacteraceae bacterium]|nr:SDR family oxidoreductase [Bryobacteraceae bacterium]